MRFQAISGGVLLAACLAFPVLATAQVAGSTHTMNVLVAKGWSVKKLMGTDVHNDEERPAVVGKVEDILIGPEGSVSYAVLNASRFMGLSSHLVLIQVDHITEVNGKLVLKGATKAMLRNLPAFEYSK